VEGGLVPGEKVPSQGGQQFWFSFWQRESLGFG
jgi:hypothetical protein